MTTGAPEPNHRAGAAGPSRATEGDSPGQALSGAVAKSKSFGFLAVGPVRTLLLVAALLGVLLVSKLGNTSGPVSKAVSPDRPDAEAPNPDPKPVSAEQAGSAKLNALPPLSPVAIAFKQQCTEYWSAEEELVEITCDPNCMTSAALETSMNEAHAGAVAALKAGGLPLVEELIRHKLHRGFSDKMLDAAFRVCTDVEAKSWSRNATAEQNAAGERARNAYDALEPLYR